MMPFIDQHREATKHANNFIQKKYNKAKYTDDSSIHHEWIKEYDKKMWNHLTRPVTPGMVVPYREGFTFTVVGSNSYPYYVRDTIYDSAVVAKSAMRDFVDEYNSEGEF